MDLKQSEFTLSLRLSSMDPASTQRTIDETQKFLKSLMSMVEIDELLGINKKKIFQ